MLTQIVRPMVRTQVRLLANCHSTRLTLIHTIAKWLGFLGVKAEVTELDAGLDKKITISLTVEKPESCDTQDWQKIVDGVKQEENQNNSQELTTTEPIENMTTKQQGKLQRLIAYVIQAGDPDREVKWEEIYPNLQQLGLHEEILQGIRSAVRVPQCIDLLVEELEPDVAAIALPLAINIALFDQQVNSSENYALSSLLQVMKQPTTVKTNVPKKTFKHKLYWLLTSVIPRY
ncbi:MAG: hypothetical protein F6K40_12560 [Okeania sp. SIO3I5]|uniref:hypothetical protein n=1 Tax=Okeania sp. SIO3I5 TaxID=2607805 RepID=UPI0013B5DD83|nr:hypothetical protein [Okeania sp. SIO3I5]NEQ37062.1 hypothetical protein [Okeania sp. SIO3I5]